MVTSDELSSVDPWLYRQGYNVDSWLLPHTFSHDNDLLTKALHTTVTSSPHTLSPSSAVSSDQETKAKRKRDCLLNNSEGINKTTKQRRSRATKKSLTTFITTDPSNFRQMVQQVTGANYIDDMVVKPEPVRLVNGLPPYGSSDRYTPVPTLDTSAFLSNHHQEKKNVTVEAGGGGSAVEFDSYPYFPTLESWKVV